LLHSVTAGEEIAQPTIYFSGLYPQGSKVEPSLSSAGIWTIFHTMATPLAALDIFRFCRPNVCVFCLLTTIRINLRNCGR
jgi:hypothetical protein